MDKMDKKLYFLSGLHIIDNITKLYKYYDYTIVVVMNGIVRQKNFRCGNKE